MGIFSLAVGQEGEAGKPHARSPSAMSFGLLAAVQTIHMNAG